LAKHSESCPPETAINRFAPLGNSLGCDRKTVFNLVSNSLVKFLAEFKIKKQACQACDDTARNVEEIRLKVVTAQIQNRVYYCQEYLHCQCLNLKPKVA
jgi:hypothetical protein